MSGLRSRRARQHDVWVHEGPRLLADLDHGPGLAVHRRRSASRQPWPASGAALAELLEAIDLRGRGGAAFPLARKVRTAMKARGRPVVVVNAAEGEPASSKDSALMMLKPHLVLDGAQLVALAIGHDTDPRRRAGRAPGRPEGRARGPGGARRRRRRPDDVARGGVPVRRGRVLRCPRAPRGTAEPAGHHDAARRRSAGSVGGRPSCPTRRRSRRPQCSLATAWTPTAASARTPSPAPGCSPSTATASDRPCSRSRTAPASRRCSRPPTRTRTTGCCSAAITAPGSRPDAVAGAHRLGHGHARRRRRDRGRCDAAAAGRRLPGPPDGGRGRLPRRRVGEPVRALQFGLPALAHALRDLAIGAVGAPTVSSHGRRRAAAARATTPTGRPDRSARSSAP